MAPPATSRSRTRPPTTGSTQPGRRLGAGCGISCESVGSAPGTTGIEGSVTRPSLSGVSRDRIGCSVDARRLGLLTPGHQGKPNTLSLGLADRGAV